MNVKFNGYSIIKMTMDQNQDKKNNNEFEINIDNYQSDKEKNVYKVIMKINMKTNKNKIFLELEGIFELIGNFTKEQIDSFLNINAPTIIYPYCRSIISLISSCDNSNAVILPVINFAELNNK